MSLCLQPVFALNQTFSPDHRVHKIMTHVEDTQFITTKTVIIGLARVSPTNSI